MTRAIPLAAALAVASALAAGLGGCGNRTDLAPQAGQSLPPAPLGREMRPTAEDLLARRPQAAPERSVELRRRSEEREDDPFDLPPIDPLRPAAPANDIPPGPCPDELAADRSDRLACAGDGHPGGAG